MGRSLHRPSPLSLSFLFPFSLSFSFLPEHNNNNNNNQNQNKFPNLPNLPGSDKIPNLFGNNQNNNGQNNNQNKFSFLPEHDVEDEVDRLPRLERLQQRVGGAPLRRRRELRVARHAQDLRVEEEAWLMNMREF